MHCVRFSQLLLEQGKLVELVKLELLRAAGAVGGAARLAALKLEKVGQLVSYNR